MKLSEITEAVVQNIPVAEIQPTEEWGAKINKQLLRTDKAVSSYYDKLQNGGKIQPLEISLIKKAPLEYRKIIKPLPDKKYYLHDGHHRLAAAMLANLKTVPVKIVKHRWT